MTKILRAFCALFLMVAWALPVAAQETTRSAAPRINLAALSGTKAPPKNYSVQPGKEQTAQNIGCVCRNGMFYCVGVGCGPVGYVCYGCGGSGLWSNW